MPGISFDCGNGLHAPLCPGCGCDCHGPDKRTTRGGAAGSSEIRKTPAGRTLGPTTWRSSYLGPCASTRDYDRRSARGGVPAEGLFCVCRIQVSASMRQGDDAGPRFSAQKRSAAPPRSPCPTRPARAAPLSPWLAAFNRLVVSGGRTPTTPTALVAMRV